MNITLNKSGLSLDFPLPPHTTRTTTRTMAMAMTMTTQSSSSPTPSLSYSSSPSSNSSNLPLTSPYSDNGDDDHSFHLTPSKLHHRRVVIKPVQVLKHTPDRSSSLLPTYHPDHEISWLNDVDEDRDEDEDYVTDTEEVGTWYTHELSQIFTASSPLSPIPTTTHSQIRRESTVIPSFQSKRRRTAAARFSKTQHPHPPPILPVPPTPSSLVSASRTLPKISIPANILSLADEADYESDTPDSVYSQEEVNARTFEDDHSKEHQLHIELSLSPINLDFADEMAEFTTNRNRKQDVSVPRRPPPPPLSKTATTEFIAKPTQPLHSKWSPSFTATSTNTTTTTTTLTRTPRSPRSPSSSSSSKLHFLHIGGGKRKKGSTETTPSSPTHSMSYWSPSSHSPSPSSTVTPIPPKPRSRLKRKQPTRRGGNRHL